MSNTQVELAFTVPIAATTTIVTVSGLTGGDNDLSFANTEVRASNVDGRLIGSNVHLRPRHSHNDFDTAAIGTVQASST